MKVIASSIRKGNIIEREDGQLYVVLTAESFHPGKGTPTTQIDMRRLSDGVKTTDRYKTTEQVERAYGEDSNFSYLFQDGDGYHFMNSETYDQIVVPAEVIGEQALYFARRDDLRAVYLQRHRRRGSASREGNSRSHGDGARHERSNSTIVFL